MYNATDFADYYEILCVDRRADQGVIENIYRHLVKKYHPDHARDSDISRFNSIVEAYSTLKDPMKRREYDKLFSDARNDNMALSSGYPINSEISVDVDVQNRVLVLLYDKRRSDAAEAGMGEMKILNFIGCTEKSLQFVLWYLKEKGFIVREETGSFSITMSGVDHLILQHTRRAEILQIADASTHPSH